MAEQKADTEELNQLIQTMGEMVGYCSALRQGASGFAYMLPNEWQGSAMNAFLGAFEAWAVGAEQMRASAEKMREQAEAAHTAYELTMTDLDSNWAKLQSTLG